MVCLFCSAHRHRCLDTGAVHEMEFSGTRVDDLVRRVVSPGEMMEIYEGRADFLYCRDVVFDRPVQVSELHMDTDPDCRPLRVKIR